MKSLQPACCSPVDSGWDDWVFSDSVAFRAGATGRRPDGKGTPCDGGGVGLRCQRFVHKRLVCKGDMGQRPRTAAGGRRPDGSRSAAVGSQCSDPKRRGNRYRTIWRVRGVAARWSGANATPAEPAAATTLTGKRTGRGNTANRVRRPRTRRDTNPADALRRKGVNQLLLNTLSPEVHVMTRCDASRLIHEP